MSTKKYLVTVSRVEYFSTDVLVEAANEEEAKETAMYEANFGVTHYVDGDTDMVAELVRRWNAYPELVEALKGLVQTIEFQAEGNFLNEDADEGEENDLTRARALLQTLKP